MTAAHFISPFASTVTNTNFQSIRQPFSPYRHSSDRCILQTLRAFTSTASAIPPGMGLYQVEYLL